MASTSMTHSQDKASALSQGLVIFIYLAILTGIEFFIALTMDSAPLLVLVAIVKAGLVAYYYMHIYRLTAVEAETDHHSYAYKLVSNRIGLWLFLLSDSFVFGGLLTTRIYLLGPTRPALNQFLGLTVTAVLLVSSFFMNRAETSMEHGDRKSFLLNATLTMLLGVAFLLGVVAVEWPNAIREGVTPASGTAGAVFFMMTGMHAFHVFTGVLFLLVVLRNARRGLYSAEKHWAVEAATVYWHFVDLVWIFFYPALYLIGKLIG
ncbi:MAG TPA: cytochrome c oxidase subunit 3 [Anaerolineales bacterium]|nr:cytochrome c oxidase subunit 3 [Anaerolineales bacterium]